MRIQNNQQQNFGMIKFQVPDGVKYADSISCLLDATLPRKGIHRQILDYNLGIYAIESTPKNESLLAIVFEKFGMSPQFINKRTRLPLKKPPRYEVSPDVKKAIELRPITALNRYLDEMF